MLTNNSKSWHQIIRKPYSNPASLFVEDILGLKTGLISRHLKLSLTFFLSGLLHLLADLSGGLTVSQSGSLNFFSIQVLGIIIEDFVQFLYRKLTSNGSKKGETKTWEKAVGWAWVVFFFLFWTSPAFYWPHIYKMADGAGEREWGGRGWKMVPFPIVGRFLSLS